MWRKPVILVLIALTLALVPASAAAQGPPDDDDGLSVRINGDYTIERGDSVRRLVVLHGDATIEGTARTVVVVDGDAVVAGRVEEQIVVVSGRLELASTADVDDVLLVRSSLDRQAGAVVRGDIDRRGAWVWPGVAILLGIVFILGSIVVGVAAALVFAAFGGRQLGEAAARMTGRPAESISFGILTVVLGPIAAALLLASVIGIPVGLVLLFFVLPALAVLGGVVAATWLGLLILTGNDPARRPERPFAASLIGVAIFAGVMLIPGIGFLAVVLMSIWGVGALVSRIVRPPDSARGEPPEPEPPPGTEPEPVAN